MKNNTRILVLLTFLGSILISLAVSQAQPIPATSDIAVTQPAEPAAVPPAPVPDWVAEPVVAAPVAPAEIDNDPLGFGVKLFNAVKSGEYWYALGLFLALLTIGFRAVMSWKKIAWFSTDRGGVAAIGITSLLSLGALALMADKAPSLPLLWGVLAGTVAAMGGYVGIKKLMWPAK